jgi:lauroyl/myristoyl acyltransferase
MEGESTSLSQAAARLPRRALAQASDLIRVTALLILHPAALYLPRSWALRIADSAGSLMELSPLGGRMRQWMRMTFPHAEDPDRLAREWLRRPFRDYITSTRVAEAGESDADWTIESRNEPAILTDPSQSVIIATGHFSRQACGAVFAPSVCPKGLVSVVAPVEQASQGARAMRIRVQLGEMVKGIRELRKGRVEFVEVGARGIATKLLQLMRGPNKLLVMSVDVPWPKNRSGGYDRPFAGHATQHFALGTARLSRATQCPIVVCVPYLDGDKIIMEWSEPIPPADARDDSADQRVTDQMLDVIERAVGRRPGQYVLAVGHDRYWDPKTETWNMLGAHRLAAESPAKAARAVTTSA